MRFVFIQFVLFLTGIVICSAQDSVYSYKIEYDMRLNFSGYKKYNASMLFNNSSAYFEYKEDRVPVDDITESDGGRKVSVKISDTSTTYVMSDLNAKIITELVKGFDLPFYYIREYMAPINWTITDTVKAIGSYNCYKASGKFGGRNYTAWFTTEIPARFGPWKLHGLPGAVLEASDNTGEVDFLAKGIYNITVPVSNVQKLEKYPLISKQEYFKKLNNYIDDLGKSMGTKLGRGFKVQTKKPKMWTMEIYEE